MERILEELPAEMERVLHFGPTSSNHGLEMARGPGAPVDVLVAGHPMAASAAVGDQLETLEGMVMSVVLLQNTLLPRMSLAQESR